MEASDVIRSSWASTDPADEHQARELFVTEDVLEEVCFFHSIAWQVR